MLRLHGSPISNYYNMAKMALLEKGLEFEEVSRKPSQDAVWLACSPMGKIPSLETGQGHLSETQVILDYLEDLAPEPALLPADPFARAQVRELSRVIELYVELPARRCHDEAFFGGTVPAITRSEVEPALIRGIAGVGRLARFSPWIAGPEFTQADIVWHHSIVLAARVAEKMFDLDLLADLDGAEAHREAMSARASAQRISRDRKGAS